nr:hypothetical protein B0A51_15426 [Rachicladosporium sp. CCFEE 5018]
MSSTNPQIKTLTLSLNNYLHGRSILPILAASFDAVTTPDIRSRFDNQPFDVMPTDANLLTELQANVKSGNYDGVLIGWCLRGYPERTALFEAIVNAVVESKDARTKLMFCTGQEDLGKAILRTFGSEALVDNE